MKVGGKQKVSTAAPGADTGAIKSENKQQEIAIGPPVAATAVTAATTQPTSKPPPPQPPPTRSSVLPPSDDKRPGDTPTIYAEIQDPGKAEQVIYE